jgi:hypothetical protein
MNEAETLAFVQINAQALGIAIDAASAARVAAHLQRTAAMAQLLEGVALSPADEPAEIYCPKPH